MGFLSGNFEKSGAGVAKNQNKKHGLKLFFEIYIRKFWALIKLNFMYFVCCIPIVTIGPATAGFTKILKNYSQEKNAFLWEDFWESFRKNFKQSMIMGIIDIIMTAGAVLGGIFYFNQIKESNFNYIPLALCIAFALTFAMMNYYIYLMIVSVDLPLKTIIKNSFILTCVGLKNSLLSLILVVVISLAVLVGAWFLPVLGIIIPTMLLSFLGFIVVFNCYPVIEKHVINPFYEAQGASNPDYDYLKPEDGGTVFEDRGGKEKPIDLTKGRKGKIIK